MAFTLANVLEILIIYQSVLFIIFLHFNRTSKPVFVKALIAIYLLIIVHFSSMLFEEKVIRSSYFLGPFFGLLYGPLYFFYTKSLIIENIKFTNYAYHFIVPVSSLPFLLLLNDKLVNAMPLIGLIVTLYFIGYLTASLYTIFYFRRHVQNELSYFHHINLKWLEVIIYIQFGTLLVTLMESYFQSKSVSDILIVAIFILVLVLINCFYYLGLKQVRLYKGLADEKVNLDSVSEYTISEDLFKSYLKKLVMHIENDAPYLDFNISLDQLSKELSISKRNLSHIINKEFQLNFYDFINQFRLERAKKDLSETNKPIKEIMYDSGFANKASFNLVFKKDTGLTPTQFRANKKVGTHTGKKTSN